MLAIKRDLPRPSRRQFLSRRGRRRRRLDHRLSRAHGTRLARARGGHGQSHQRLSADRSGWHRDRALGAHGRRPGHLYRASPPSSPRSSTPTGRSSASRAWQATRSSTATSRGAVRSRARAARRASRARGSATGTPGRSRAPCSSRRPRRSGACRQVKSRWRGASSAMPRASRPASASSPIGLQA